MDPVTQGALGAAIAEAAFRKRLGPKATLFGALTAMSPDLDVVVALWSEWAMLEHHRALTHSLVALPFFAVPVGWLGLRWFGKAGDGLWSWVHLAFWVLITHPLLDVCTTYGTLLFYPLSHFRYAFDNVAIIDPAYTVPLLAVVAWNQRRSVSPNFRQIGAWCVLLLTTAYLGFGKLQSREAQQAGETQLAEMGFQPVEVRGIPTMFNLFLWRVTGRNEQGDICAGLYSTLAEKPIPFQCQEALQSPFFQKALESWQGKIFAWFAQGLVTGTLEEHPDGTRTVFLSDRRYGFLVEPMGPSVFTAIFRFGADGTLLEATRQRGRPQVDLPAEFRTLWDTLWSGAPS